MKVISFDVFDTLLLRNSFCEKRRFEKIAENASIELSRHGIKVEPEVLLRSRREAQKLAYRALEAEEPWSDLTLERILCVQSSLLGMQPALLLPAMQAAEIDTEAHVLRSNKALVREIASERSRGGMRAIAISDTYLSAAQIADLFGRVIGENPVDAIYTSADLGVTKKGGRLFTAVLEREGLSPHQVRHVGDDWLADKQRPEEAGISSRHAPRPWPDRFLRRLDAAVFRLTVGAMP